MTIDVQVLAATFAARVQLAKKTKEEVLAESATEWEATQRWVASKSEQPGAFQWFCDEFDLDPGSVRRAIRERRK